MGGSWLVGWLGLHWIGFVRLGWVVTHEPISLTTSPAV